MAKETIPNAECWANMLDGFKHFLKVVVKETVEEVISDKIANANLEDKRLTVEELCQRWHISKSTLYNWQKDKIIAPMPLCGRKKVYSMKDILYAESDGIIKNVS